MAVNSLPLSQRICLLDPFANRGLSGEVLKLFAVLRAFFARSITPRPPQRMRSQRIFHNANAPRVVFASSVGLLSLLLFVRSFGPQLSRTRLHPTRSRLSVPPITMPAGAPIGAFTDAS